MITCTYTRSSRHVWDSSARDSDVPLIIPLCALRFFIFKPPLPSTVSEHIEMNSINEAVVAERPEEDVDNETHSDPRPEDEPALSTFSTSESGMSNAFLDEIHLGSYDGWKYEHNRWQGRWVRDDKMKKFLFSMQAFQFLDLQTFLSERKAIFEPESFQKATNNLDKLLADAELDIVGRNKRFPLGAYHFIDDTKWSRTITDLYVALKYIQKTDMELIVFYNLWTAAIVPAVVENLSERITREKFESVNRLSWSYPSFESLYHSSNESGSEGNVSGRRDIRTMDCKNMKSPNDLDITARNDPSTEHHDADTDGISEQQSREE